MTRGRIYVVQTGHELILPWFVIIVLLKKTSVSSYHELELSIITVLP
jgi:hypothetical protein